MEATLSKNDYKVLITIYKYGCTNEIKSATIAKLSEITELSISKIRKTVVELKKLNYIREGALSCNAKTYYITDIGNDKVLELIKE